MQHSMQLYLANAIPKTDTDDSIQEVYPSYYPSFACVGGTCRHNCCIGWEIDIDNEALRRYQQAEGDFADRLRQGISMEETPHFRLDGCQRCVFLNQHNLCSIILNMGEDALCEICAEHPRFRNHLPGRVEIGLGLCCEEAGRLILGRPEPMRLLTQGTPETDDEVIALRDEVILLLQDRSRSIRERLARMKQLMGCPQAAPPLSSLVELLLSLERLDEQWTHLLNRVLQPLHEESLAAFDAHMEHRMTEYEQLAVYLVYRHMANACSEQELAACAAFVAWGTELLYRMGAAQFAHTGSFTPDDQVELARLFSSELEYSEENMAILLNPDGQL